MAWKDLSIAQRSQLMNLMRHNGISSLSEMRRLYDLSSPSLSSLEENTFNMRPQAPIYAEGGEKPPYNGEIRQGKRWNFIDRYRANNPKVAHGLRKAGVLLNDAGRIMLPQRTRDVEINPRILTDFRDLSQQVSGTDNPDSAVDRMSRVATPAAAVARVGKPLLDNLNEEVLPWAEGARNFANKLRIADRIVNMGQFIDDFATPVDQFAKGGHKIHIKKANRGKFTALKKRTGHSASWFKAHGTPAQKKMAIFALNAKHWKHSHGGIKF